MGTRVGYVGSLNTEVGWWDYWWRVPIAVNSNHSLTIHDCNYRSGAVTYEDSYATTPDPMVTLDADEYPTAIQFTDYRSDYDGWYNTDSSLTGQVSMTLCYSSEKSIKKLTYPFVGLRLEAGMAFSDTMVHSIQDGQTVMGQALDLFVYGDRQICLRRQCKATITTDYVAKDIAAVFVGNGSVTISASTANRGTSVTVTATPAFGYVIDGAEASAGTLTQTSENTWTFVMPTPAQDVTITVRFSVEPHKTVKYHDGTGFVECIPHVYEGGEFNEVEPYYYNGSEWVLCSQT